MATTDVEKLLAELNDLIALGPGSNDVALRRAEGILAILTSYGTSPYVREKASTAGHDFRIWFSPRKWQRYGADGSQLRAHLFADVAKLEGALQMDGRLDT